MKKNFRFLAMAVVAMAAAVFTGCSSDDDFLAPYEESAILPSMETIAILPRPTVSR